MKAKTGYKIVWVFFLIITFISYIWLFFSIGSYIYNLL